MRRMCAVFSRLVAVAVAVAALLSAGMADAGWHHRRGGGSDGGSYGSAGGSAGGSASDCGSHGGGSHGGRHGWRARHHGSGGGSGGGSSGNGSGGGSYGGGSYGGSAGGSYGGSAGGTLIVTPEMAKHVPVSNDAVLLTVEVPRDAKVWINKHETGSTGETRLYTSHGMKPEKKHDFVVRMRAYIDGKWVDKTKTVSLEAGERETVSLAQVLEEEKAAQAKAAQAPPANTQAAVK